MSLPPGATALPVASLALVILDGWGLAPAGPGNAISLAETPVFDELWSTYPHTRLSAGGRDVGLPAGQMGNSEVGHLNLGAGAVVKQDLARIDDAIADGSFFENPRPQSACELARSSPRGRLHLIGLVSDGGVHSGWEHIEAMIEMAARGGRSRPRPPRLHRRPRHPADLGRRLRRGARALAAPSRPDRHARRPLLRDGSRQPLGAHEAGLRRDRPRRGPRRPRAPPPAIEAARERGETDEFIRPTVIGDYDGVADGDAVASPQLPARPGAPARSARSASRTSTSSRAGAYPRSRSTTHDQVPRGLAVPDRVRRRRLRGRRSRRCSPRAAHGSSTSPRPRSTRT